MTARVLAASLVLAGIAVAQGLDVDPDAYRRAAADGIVGGVRGRAYAEPRTPAGATQPLAGTVVTLLPRSAGFLQRLEQIKATARDSQRAFLGAATEIRRAREAYESRLWEVGFPELVRLTVADAAGGFSVTHLPAGEWVLIGTRAVFVNRPSPKVSARERQVFTRGPRLVGYYAVSVWLRELTIAGGGAGTVDLMDRNVWFSGVVEERPLDAGP